MMATMGGSQAANPSEKKRYADSFPARSDHFAAPVADTGAQIALPPRSDFIH